MLNIGDRVRVVTDRMRVVEPGTLATVTDLAGEYTLAIVDGYKPTEFDLAMAARTNVTSGSIPFRPGELENA